MYCINLRVSTYVGIGYESGSWEESNVPNIGYVTYILNNFYPTVPEPAGLSANQQAAAVQSAIWYFTDGYVLNTAASSTVREATAAIVAAAQAAGPVVEPPAPEVSITPESDTVGATSSAGPTRSPPRERPTSPSPFPAGTPCSRMRRAWSPWQTPRPSHRAPTSG